MVEEKDKILDDKISIEEMASFCKRKGFVYPSSEIYGGLAGFFDYGPMGSELKKNMKDSWWKFHVQDRDDVVGIDGSIITHPKVWEASGHVGCFADIMITCSNPKCKEKLRADIFIEEQLNVAADGWKAEQINKTIKDNKLVCPNCQGEFEEANDFNLMFRTKVGPKEDDSSIAYLRPETAQIMFVDFKHIVDNSRLKLPFGIAQIGRAFRNEISPRHFLFRCREFEQMEIEYFIHPEKLNDCPFVDSVMDHELFVYSSEMQEKEKDAEKMTIRQALDKKIIKTTWHGYWLATEHKWFIGLGANPDKFRIRQHLNTEKSHYALDTWDLEYEFPFGYKELQGMANRTDYDLKQHMKFSNQDLSLYDEESKKKIVPYVVAEPSQGVDRAFLVFMFDAFTKRKDQEGKDVVVLKLHPKITPIKFAVFPLINKLNDEAKKLYEGMKSEFVCTYDKSGSVGRRYARADESGIPYCITFDFDSKEKGDITIRDRDTTKQIQIKIDDLKETMRKLLNEDIDFEKAGNLI